MYVTRPLSLYRNFGGALSIRPPEAPHSGYLVVRDEESEAQDSLCCGVLKDKRVKRLPFPQDKILKLVHAHSAPHEEAFATKVWFIPVLDHPLSTNRYYVIKAKGKYKGKAYACSRQNDIEACCFNNVIVDVKPIPFDHRDIYQQVEIHPYYNGGFFAKSVARDGFPPKFLRRKGWEVHISASLHIELSEAQGVNRSQPSHLPSFSFRLPCKRSDPIVIGEWRCPFVFVREEVRAREQMRRSLLYEMSLEQWWEEIYSCENGGGQGNIVNVRARVQREVTLVHGMEAAKEARNRDDGFVWFRVDDGNRRRRLGVGLSLAITEKMRWVQERGGWVGAPRHARVDRVEEIASERGWRRFGCYVLVEGFVLRRLDGSVLVSCNFRHTHRIQCKWD